MRTVLYILSLSGNSFYHSTTVPNNYRWEKGDRYATLYDGNLKEDAARAVRAMGTPKVAPTIWANPQRILVGSTIRHMQAANIIGLEESEYTKNKVFTDKDAYDLWHSNSGSLTKAWDNLVENPEFPSILVITDILMLWYMMYKKDGGEEELGPFNQFATAMRVAEKYSQNESVELTRFEF